MAAKGTGDHSFTWEEGKYAEKDEGNVGLHAVEHACRKKKKNSTTVGAFRCSSLATKMGLSTANIGLPLSPKQQRKGSQFDFQWALSPLRKNTMKGN